MSSLTNLRRAFDALGERLIAHTPHVASALVLLLAGALLGWLLAAGARRLTRRLKLDDLLGRTGWSAALARADIVTTPSAILVRLVFWIVFLTFLVLATAQLGFNFAALPLRDFLGYLPRILGAVLLLLLGAVLAAVLGRGVGVALAKIDFAQHRLLAGAVQWLILVVISLAAIEHLGFDVTVIAQLLTNLVTIFVAALAITFALGGKEVARNMLAGYYARERFHAGDRLALPEGEGELEGIGALNAELRTTGGSLIIPNSRLLETAVRRLDG